MSLFIVAVQGPLYCVSVDENPRHLRIRAVLLRTTTLSALFR